MESLRGTRESFLLMFLQNLPACLFSEVLSAHPAAYSHRLPHFHHITCRTHTLATHLYYYPLWETAWMLFFFTYAVFFSFFNLCKLYFSPDGCHPFTRRLKPRTIESCMLLLDSQRRCKCCHGDSIKFRTLHAYTCTNVISANYITLGYKSGTLFSSN